MKMKTLTNDQALYCANIFNDYFEKFSRIDEYMRDQKLSQIGDVPSALPGMGLEGTIFSKFDMSPKDMEFEILEPDNETYDTLLNMTSSHTNMSSVPGKNLKIAVREKKYWSVGRFYKMWFSCYKHETKKRFVNSCTRISKF